MESTSKTGSAREAILSSIRENLAASKPFDAAHREHHGYSGIPVSPIRVQLDRAAMLENFKNSLELVGGKYSLARDINEAAGFVKGIVEGIGAAKIGVSDSPLIREIVDRAGVAVIENADAEYLFDSHLGITGAQWGIAETGTLVLESEKESHRLTSLVPPVHLCILRAADIRQTLGELLSETEKDLSRTMTFITGASRTSDIELTLAIGVHGPGELYVIVLDD